MPTPPTRGPHLHHVIAGALLALAIGFAGVWLYMQHAERQRREVRYFQLPSVAISRDGHSMAASVALRTSAADAGWAEKNKVALEQITKSTLLEADPVKARAPGGLQVLQETLRQKINTRLQTTNVQEVVVTDFLVSEGDQ